VGFVITNQLLIRFSALSGDGEKNKFSGTLLQLFIDFKKAYDLVKREVLQNILTEFQIPMKFIRIIKICINIQ
jgi:hypothetical protein